MGAGGLPPRGRSAPESVSPSTAAAMTPYGRAVLIERSKGPRDGACSRAYVERTRCAPGEGPMGADGESTPTRARARSISSYGSVTSKRGARSAVLRGRGRIEARRPDPARLGHVHGDPVGGRVLDLDVRVAVAAAHAEGGVDVLARRGAGRRQLLGDLFEALDLEAEMMDAGPVLAAL